MIDNNAVKKCLSTPELHRQFLNDLGSDFILISDIEQKPLLILHKQFAETVYKVYIYNCTNPPGGRQLDEYKIQLKLPGQREGERGVLDESDGTIILIVGFANYDCVDNGVWIIWDTSRHISFAFNANLQVKAGMIIGTTTKCVFCTKKRGNGEVVVLSDRSHLKEAIDLRLKNDLEVLLGD